MSKPGVMIYFGDARVVEKMTDAEAGALFRGILGYAERGVLPAFADSTEKLGLLWVRFQQAVDADSERYAETVRKRSYATYVRECKKRNETPLAYSEWPSDDTKRYQMIPDDITQDQMIPNDTTRYQKISNNNNNTSIINNTSINSNNKLYISNRKKEERKKAEKMLRDSISFLPADIEEFYYLLDQFGEESMKKAVSEAASRGMKGETAWLYIQNRCVFI